MSDEEQKRALNFAKRKRNSKRSMSEKLIVEIERGLEQL